MYFSRCNCSLAPFSCLSTPNLVSRPRVSRTLPRTNDRRSQTLRVRRDSRFGCHVVVDAGSHPVTPHRPPGDAVSTYSNGVPFAVTVRVVLHHANHTVSFTVVVRPSFRVWTAASRRRYFRLSARVHAYRYSLFRTRLVRNRVIFPRRGNRVVSVAGRVDPIAKAFGFRLPRERSVRTKTFR